MGRRRQCPDIVWHPEHEAFRPGVLFPLVSDAPERHPVVEFKTARQVLARYRTRSLLPYNGYSGEHRTITPHRPIGDGAACVPELIFTLRPCLWPPVAAAIDWPLTDWAITPGVHYLAPIWQRRLSAILVWPPVRHRRRHAAERQRGPAGQQGPMIKARERREVAHGSPVGQHGAAVDGNQCCLRFTMVFLPRHQEGKRRA